MLIISFEEKFLKAAWDMYSYYKTCTFTIYLLEVKEFNVAVAYVKLSNN